MGMYGNNNNVHVQSLEYMGYEMKREGVNDKDKDRTLALSALERNSNEVWFAICMALYYFIKISGA